MSEQTETAEIPRDRWGRPLIPHPETGRIEPYTRASTLSKAIDNGGGLADWKVGKVIEGLRADPTLLDLDAPPKMVADLAMTLAGANAAAELGTLVHALTERVDAGEHPGEIDIPGLEGPQAQRIVATLLAYRDATQPLEVLGAELFVASPGLMAAGTFDRVVRYDGVNYIADIKTGRQDPKYPHSAAVQMAVYAHGRRWDPVRGWLASMPDHVSLGLGIMIHLPVTGEPRCTLHWVDIAAGHRMARVAAAVRDWRRTRPAEDFE